MRILKITAAMLLAAVVVSGLCSCGESRKDYMTGNCSKNGVSAFIAENPTLSELGFTEKTCYNITPDDFGGITLYKSSQSAYTVVVYPGYSYTFLDLSSAPGVINALTCDPDGNGVADILFTYADTEMNEYGIGLYDGVKGYSSSVFRGDGDLALYLVRQEAEEGMPDVFSVFTVTVTAFGGNCADLGCKAVRSIGTVTSKDGKPVFNIDSGVQIDVVGFRAEGIKKIIVTAVTASSEDKKTYEDEADIKKIAEFVKGVQTSEEADPPAEGTTYIIAAVYENNSVSYAYVHDGGYFKLHGQSWRKISGKLDLPF
ncbi:MAG: hypothetical protein J5879_10425 [Clostridia bacterium]|nr:hypothetical protein [Clostridia bacterium]